MNSDCSREPGNRIALRSLLRVRVCVLTIGIPDDLSVSRSTIWRMQKLWTPITWSEAAADYWDEFFPPTPALGYLYVIEFDSGWAKVGLTRNWLRRQSDLRSQYRKQGWKFSRPPWKSCVVNDDDLRIIEERLIAEARRTSDGSDFNPFVPGRGRDVAKPAGTELFRGCSFDYLVAYADVLARTDAFR